MSRWIAVFLAGLSILLSACGGGSESPKATTVPSATPCLPEQSAGEMVRLVLPDLRARLVAAGVDALEVAGLARRVCPDDPVAPGEWFDLNVRVADVNDDAALGPILTTITLSLAEWPDARVTITLHGSGLTRSLDYRNRQALDLVIQQTAGSDLVEQLQAP